MAFRVIVTCGLMVGNILAEVRSSTFTDFIIFENVCYMFELRSKYLPLSLLLGH